MREDALSRFQAPRKIFIIVLVILVLERVSFRGCGWSSGWRGVFLAGGSEDFGKPFVPALWVGNCQDAEMTWILAPREFLRFPPLAALASSFACAGWAPFTFQRAVLDVHQRRSEIEFCVLYEGKTGCGGERGAAGHSLTCTLASASFEYAV